MKEKMLTLNVPRVVIGGTASGTGKTTVTCAVLMALKKRNINIKSFKCGPDYIDPMFHRKVMGIPSANLDLFFTDRETMLWLMNSSIEKHGSEMAVIEGVMGYYDGIAGTSSDAGTYDLAVNTESPAILVADGKGRSLSLIAEIKGFLEFRKESRIKGVIINRISKGMYDLLKNMIEEELGIKALGYLPLMDDVSFKSRHLGLVTADEIEDIGSTMEKLGRQAEESVDIDGIIEMAHKARETEFSISGNVEKYMEILKIKERETEEKGRVRIAVAKDEAFCFYYEENLEMIEKMGGDIVYFSPVHDRHLPDNISGIILGGGYPELYAERLEKNSDIREEIYNLIKKGIPCVAECGGFMYLHEKILNKDGSKNSFTGILNGETYPLDKMGRFGYINLEFMEDTILGRRGTVCRGHEFHYWESVFPGKSVTASKPLRKRKWECIVADKNIFAGFPHIFLWSNPELAGNFIDKIRYFYKNK